MIGPMRRTGRETGESLFVIDVFSLHRNMWHKNFRARHYDRIQSFEGKAATAGLAASPLGQLNSPRSNHSSPSVSVTSANSLPSGPTSNWQRSSCRADRGPVDCIDLIEGSLRRQFKGGF
jgi:hypothetical protein